MAVCSGPARGELAHWNFETVDIALNKAGLANLYYASLKPWRDMVANGLTTFAENPDPTRSDCHAWSASPVYDFLSTICGIIPGSPGFETATIRPALGGLKEVHGSMPHPKALSKST